MMYQGLPAAMKVYAEVRPEEMSRHGTRRAAGWSICSSTARSKKHRGAQARGEPPAALQTEVELEDVWFRYDRNGADIVRGISAKINKGELFCMVGGNGVGKAPR
ncbi:MAG: hypothetical protein ACLSB9_32840 [Hydrogeniiclostridium mannosilyticum]